MKHSDPTELMHAVLDGEASAEESRALQRLLDSDADARAEFAALERLFKARGPGGRGDGGAAARGKTTCGFAPTFGGVACS